MIVSVVRSYRFSPFIINDLFVDRMDHLGLEYWHDDAIKVDNSLKSDD